MREIVKIILSISCLSFVFVACGLFSGEDEDDKPAIAGKIVFSTPDDTESENNQIYVMNADGSGIQQLTHLENDEAAQPSWSPDGKQIVFSTSLNSTSEGMSLYIMNADGSDLHPMKERPNTNVPTLGSNARWNPDGTKITYDFCINCNAFGKNYEIFIYDFETDSVLQVTDHLGGDTHPAWSPDGQQLAFVSHRDYYDTDTLRHRSDLYSVNIDGTDLQRLTETGNAGRPVWLAQEEKLIYWSENQLYLLNLHTNSSKIISINLPGNIGFRPLDISINGDILLLHMFNYEDTKEEQSLQMLNLDGDLKKISSQQNFSGADWYDNEN